MRYEARTRFSVGPTSSDFDHLKADEARYTRFPCLNGVGVLTANYCRHVFVPHSHSTYVIGVVERGAARVNFQNRQEVFGPDDVLVINPNLVHSAAAVTREGWRYRAIHLTPPALESFDRSGSFEAPKIADSVLARRVVALIGRVLVEPEPARVRRLIQQLVSAVWEHARPLPDS